MINFNFIDRKMVWFSFSGIVIAGGLVGLLVKGLTFGIEFEGGTMFEIKFAQPITIEKVRETVKPLGLGDSVIQLTRGGKAVFIRSHELGPEKQQEVKKVLTGIGAKDFVIQGVGASWGARLTQGTIVALLVSLIVVSIFIAIRFEFKMGVAAVIALVHDILIAVGLYALVGREVTTSTVAAFLTILGYSLYDTIVVFDRVRENTAGLRKTSYSDMINTSILQSLRRSINTSLTSIIPVTCLLVFGGETLKDFAFALLVGLTTGAYSSIFIAPPILAMWKETEPKYQALRKKLVKAV